MRNPMLLSVLAALPLWGCPGDKDDTGDTMDTSETGETGDTETGDTETGDTETGDTNEEHTGGPATGGYTSFTGASSVQTTANGIAVCDIEANVTGTAYTGECNACVFAFDVETEIVSDNSGSSCYPYPNISLVPQAPYDPFRIFWWDTYWYEYDGYFYEYNDLAATDFYYYYDGGYIGPYRDFTTYGGGYYYPASFDGTTFSSALLYEGTFYYYVTAGDQACGPTLGNGSPNLDGAETLTSGLGCPSPGSYGELSERDVFTVQVADGAEALDITVDTVAEGSAFDPIMFVTGPDGCVVGSSDDAWECTYPPPDYGCPAINVPNPQSGTYTISVYTFGTCAGGAGEYSLTVAGGFGLTLTADNETELLEVDDVAVELNVSLTGTVE